MVSVSAEQSAVGAYPHAVLNTDNLKLAAMFLTELFSKHSFKPQIFHWLGQLVNIFVHHFCLFSVLHDNARTLLLRHIWKCLFCQSDQGEVFWECFSWCFACTLRSNIMIAEVTYLSSGQKNSPSLFSSNSFKHLVQNVWPHSGNRRGINSGSLLYCLWQILHVSSSNIIFK